MRLAPVALIRKNKFQHALFRIALFWFLSRNVGIRLAGSTLEIYPGRSLPNLLAAQAAGPRVRRGFPDTVGGSSPDLIGARYCRH